MCTLFGLIATVTFESTTIDWISGKIQKDYS